MRPGDYILSPKESPTAILFPELKLSVSRIFQLHLFQPGSENKSKNRATVLRDAVVFSSDHIFPSFHDKANFFLFREVSLRKRIKGLKFQKIKLKLFPQQIIPDF
jgi:hypothetical protein